jgi:hypothetical protein
MTRTKLLMNSITLILLFGACILWSAVPPDRVVYDFTINEIHSTQPRQFVLIGESEQVTVTSLKNGRDSHLGVGDRYVSRVDLPFSTYQIWVGMMGIIGILATMIGVFILADRLDRPEGIK